MGSCFSLQVSDQTLNRIFNCLIGKSYIRTLEKNLRALQREMEDLRAIQHEVQNKVARDEARHQRRLEAVQVWLDRVNSVDIECKDLLSVTPVELQKLCLCGLCSKYVCSSYKYGKKVFLLLEEVKKLNSEGNFDEVSQPPPRSEVEERPTQPTIGQEDMLEKAWNRLMEDGVGIMGLHGMGGVGKTTLFKKIHNKFAEIGGTFDIVIWIVVSKGVMISKLQEDIAEKLHLCDDLWKNKNESDKATDIHRVLKGKRFVLMLDDIWEKVDLEAIGIPYPSEVNKCKVAFTTRSREVCGEMGDHKPMQVNCLEPEDAWELFKNKVGDNTLSSDPVIVELAREVAQKCRGLPLALNVIGETMSSKTMVQEWEHAIHVFNTSAAEFSDMQNKILPILKYSYDSLGDEHIKSCFLYCALFPEDGEIYNEKLIDYWICEGFIGEDQVIKRARNKGYAMLGTLTRANLLTKVGTYYCVMHDVVREMALWIASDFGKQKENFVVQAGVGLHEIPKVKDWGAVRKMSLMDNDIEEITCESKCSELTTLFLQSNKLKNLPGAFIRYMQKLVVLDLSYNRDFNKLPEQISGLVSLQFLDLSNTSIEHMPIGLKELKKLTFLDLTYTDRLCSISGISRLLSLRLLRLLGSKVHGDASVLKELQQLQNLQELAITVSAELISLDQRLAKLISNLCIEGFLQKPFDLSFLASMENLSSLRVENSYFSEIKCRESETESSYLRINPKIPCFTNLSRLEIMKCHSMKDLTWILFAPNLVVLLIEDSREVGEIINKEKATNLTSITPFLKLEWLILYNLPKLESIYWSPLPFPVLLTMDVSNCPKLRKLPLNATSVSKVEEFEIHMYPPPEQENELEWEDDDTKNRFLPSIKPVIISFNLLCLSYLYFLLMFLSRLA
ncbi:LRR and NB-ARC domains-containing disease resistance protein [Arabidopsis thaliana]|uniref:LRR and NB-ARC domains-containing disease resistance protein n=1 Tax=Arabidopsis thaliana TaxID=3702 RepID=Q2V4G0_ARATH|nr:LRR and NB-ARC domains-containing disease resistance protein [Arabidopsis thaliana]AEE33800.1 LRR and NB-ARC domains-containing disease resistance protein [Arabidopsis thaliana]|eukprot:NP_001031216.1 LRR and NB-ARC domains-containing disease resistance protein [Arabidopsis thaliana]